MDKYKFDNDLLKKIREQRFKSINDMATKLGVAQNLLAKWESGSHPPTISKFLEICSILEMHPSSFFTRVVV